MRRCLLLLCVWLLTVPCFAVAQKNNIVDNIKIGGWIDGQYRYTESDDVGSSVFQIRRARLDVKGRLAERISFRLHGELASSPRLLDAYVQVHLNRYATIQIGQFKTPYTLENALSPSELELSDNTQGVNALAGYSDITGVSNYSGGRDVGIMLTGDLIMWESSDKTLPLLSYKMGVFGGNGINTKKDNMGKDFSARIDFCPFVENLILSASTYIGNYDMPYQGTLTGLDGKRIRYAAGASYVGKHLMIRGEYLYGMTDFAMFDSVQNSHYANRINTQGAYIAAGWWFYTGPDAKGRFRPLARLDYYKKDIVSDAPSWQYSCGVEWWPEKHLRLQLAYTLCDSPQTKTTEQRLTAMASVKF